MAAWVTPTVSVLLVLIFLGLGAYIWLLHRRHQADRVRWERMADRKYKEGRSEASEILRAAVDKITDDKARMAELSDRELLSETLLGLSALGRRMDRMEDSLHSLSQLEGLLESVNSQAGVLSENADLLTTQMTSLQNAAAGVQSALAHTDEAVYTLSDAAQGVDHLLTEISGQLEELGTFSSAFGDLQNQISGMLLRTNQILKVSGDNPAAALGRMDGRIEAIQSQLQNLSEGLNLMAESLEGIQDTLAAPGAREPENAEKS